MSGTATSFFDAGMFVGALLRADPRHNEARPLVEAARRGEIAACTSTGILSEVYVHLTHEKAVPRHSPEEAAQAVSLLVQPPSRIEVIPDKGLVTTLRMLFLAKKYGLKSREVHDARHAATALDAGIDFVFTYDPDDWKLFESAGLQISGPTSTMNLLTKSSTKPEPLA